MLNVVCLIGRLTADPELRYTPNGVAVANFKIAVDNGFGENKQTSFIPIVVWKGQAESCSNHLTKGKLVGIKGYLQIRSYDGQDGQKKWITEVIAENVRFLSSKDSNNDFGGHDIDFDTSDIPF